MVLIGGIKYACERCIRGHRVTTCNHTDQPLMMIKPKGRPSSQCKHCKEMRKNKNSHSSGACTCGKNKKGHSSSSVNKHCGCDSGKPCACHGKRKSESHSVTDKQHHFQQQQQILPENLQQSLPQLSKDEGKDGKVRQIGMDPLASAKPASESTRTRVGEVSIPLDEYIPSNSHSMGNVNDRLPEGFFRDVPLPCEPGHGLLDLFTDSQRRPSQPNDKPVGLFSSDLRSSDSSSSPTNTVQSPMEGVNGFFPYFPLPSATQQTSQSNHQTSSSLPKRTNSLMSSTSNDSTRPSSSSLNESVDSLLNNNNHHHHQYDSMIHRPSIAHASSQKDTLFGTFERDLQSHKQRQQHVYHNSKDDMSNRSVEVLSLTPTFMDLPGGDDIFWSDNSKDHSKNDTKNDEGTKEDESKQTEKKKRDEIMMLDPFAFSNAANDVVLNMPSL
ncbi:CYFA0S31e00298g1_1 [Cyberlindnera fabianii]|uniref:CYFA0S31e00298g1_1 n=1 Tax=Cyberlindnera fabianii TaxID=36022 RepID=A0A061BBI2_CYBFA|nr:CYFA0S31e00298g1_1 [Cyberlindnera fabianii]